jgi:hypothetical protein
MTAPGPDDDHLHRRGSGDSWQENYLFMAMDDGGLDAAFVHVARLSALGTCDVKLAVVVDGTTCSFTEHHAIPDGLDVAGFHFEIVRPWYEWHVRAAGDGRVGGAPDLLVTTGRGDVPISVDLRWEAFAPPVILSGGFDELEESGAGSSGHHYVQGGRCTGTIELRDEERRLDGWSIRDHTWGERHIVAMDRCWWTPMVFGDGRYQLGGIDMHTDDGTRTTFSFERNGDVQVGFPLLDVEIIEGDADDFAAVAIRCGDRVHVTARRVLRLPIAYYRGGGTGWVSDDALCTLELDDGRTGFGVIERNRRLTADEMAHLPEGSLT